MRETRPDELAGQLNARQKSLLSIHLDFLVLGSRAKVRDLNRLFLDPPQRRDALRFLLVVGWREEQRERRGGVCLSLFPRLKSTILSAHGKDSGEDPSKNDGTRVKFVLSDDRCFFPRFKDAKWK